MASFSQTKRGKGADGPSAPAPFLSVRDARVVRDGRTILFIPDLQIVEGEALAVLGPNGAGKSTFVNLITRQVLALHASVPPVVLRGQARPLLSEVRRTLGVVSASMQDEVAVGLPAADVVAGGFEGALGLPLRMSATERNRRREAAEALLAQVGLQGLATRDMRTLSTGQARRVLLARALAGGPEGLVLDEPCAGLDPEGMHAMRGAMRRLAQQGMTLVLVTHFIEDVIPEMRRVVMLRDGAVFADGPKERLLTSAKMSELFGIPMTVHQHEERYSLSTAY
ncbi:ATP-binding cassette domain-containing protein [Eggerthellaceae bacterium zg-1084]|uniref:ABC transporter ATP-binding protein n=1 Tax=Berryella wangjianweii TaxID=2734634 RepID=UPI0015520737|nr:ATP-binding cassette domain-containing protein [Berryella wangjianweii]NPD30950.1 ATP-binding cassette domain-containing protein [Berryella wangjianweii]NPD31815.1 ATP-binding cassette domain-containing protein [Eggerthellaceae bacterium zg-997]